MLSGLTVLFDEAFTEKMSKETRQVFLQSLEEIDQTLNKLQSFPISISQDILGHDPEYQIEAWKEHIAEFRELLQAA